MIFDTREGFYLKKHHSFKNTPLMYIIQPELEPIFSSMQKSYVLKKKKKKVEKNQERHVEKEEKIAVEIEKKPITSFSMLTNEQKIQTLLNLPESLKHISCNIRTKNDESYFGKITECKDGYVTIDSNKVKFDDIENITLIGI